MGERPLLMLVLPTLGGGGLERLSLDLAPQFVALGLDVEIVLLRATGELIGETPTEVGVASLCVERLRDAPLALARHFRRRRPAAVLASMWPLSALTLLAARMAGSKARVFAWEHVQLSRSKAIRGPSRLLLDRLGGLIYRAFDGVICVSEGVGRDLAAIARLPPGTVTVIHNAVRQPMGEPPAPDLGLAEWWDGGGRRLIAIGRLAEQKDFQTLLHAVARVRETTPCRLLILGEGPQRAQLEALRGDLGLDEAVRMPGFVPEVGAYLARTDLFILSSRWEGLGNVIIEALTYGAPVVATDCPSGPAEILEDGRYGRLTPPGDIEALAEAITASLAECPDREALRARGAVFNPRDVAARYVERMGLAQGDRGGG